MKLRRIATWSVAAVPVVVLVGFFIAYRASTNSCSGGRAVAPTHPMKAIVYCGYGSPDVMKLVDLEKPVPGDSQVLVKVHAAAVNPLDWHYVEGTPYVMRLGAGLRVPKVTRLGVDFAGTVDAVGKSVTKFKPGDEVFGGRTGAFAEYVLIRQDGAIARKPANVSFEQAASVGIAATTALQAIRDRAKVQPGQTVLINGASGGVGTFAVQIAKSYRATVTGVCSTRNVAMALSLGADSVIDYTKDDYTKGAARYDVIIDIVGNRSLSANRRMLKPKGQYVQVGDGGPSDGKVFGPIGRLAATMVYTRFVSQHLAFMLSEFSQPDLDVLAGLMQTGAMTPVIDRKYPLKETPAALKYLEQGHAKGKVVISME